MNDSSGKRKFLHNAANGICIAGIAAAGIFGIAQFNDSTQLNRYISKKVDDIGMSRMVDDGVPYRNVLAYKFLEENKQRIIDYSKKFNVPVDLIAATLCSENAERKKYQDLADVVGKFLGMNVSLGGGQVRISTAAYLDGFIKDMSEYRELDSKIKKDLMDKLETSEGTIEYIAKNLAYLMNRANRFKGWNIDDILSDPRYLGIIGTEYTKGPTNTELADAGVSAEGFGYLYELEINDFSRIFGTESVLTASNRESIESYIRKN